MEEKKSWDAAKYVDSIPPIVQPKQPVVQHSLREEIDRQLGRHLIDAQRKEQSKRGIN